MSKKNRAGDNISRGHKGDTNPFRPGQPWPPRCEHTRCQEAATHRLIHMDIDSIWTDYFCSEHLQEHAAYLQNPLHGERFEYTILALDLIEDCQPDSRPAMVRAIIRYDAGEPLPFDVAESEAAS